MKFLKESLLLVGFCFSAVQSQNKITNNNITDKVDVFIGTGAHCHNFPSAMVPFGAVVAGPDCNLRGWDAAAGYHYDAPTILGFSQQHLSGTGLIETGDLLLVPSIGKEVKLHAGSEKNPDEGYRQRFSHKDESASPGYYQVRLLDDNINAEITTTERVGFHKYTFPKTEDAHVMLDLESIINGSAEIGHAFVHVDDDQTVLGYRTSNTKWAPNRQVHFAMKFSKPFKRHRFYDGKKKIYFDTRTDYGAKKLKTVFDFDTSDGEPILIKIAVSSVSRLNALENLNTEVPHWDFDKVVKQASDKWAKELQPVIAKGSKENVTKFYAALYHTMIHPTILNDVNGEYRGISQIPAKTDGFTKYHMFSLWDTFRALHPLFTITQQKRTDDIVKSMLDFYKRNPRKMLPMWSMYQDENTVMIGLHAIPVIVDAYQKGLLTSSEAELLKSMVVSSERPGIHNNTDRKDFPSYYGQQHYLAKGYHPNDLVLSGVSATLEHAYNDWTVAFMANMLGDKEAENTFLKRSQNFNNVWDPETKFFRAKLNNGKFREPFDPRAYHRETFTDRDYVEGNAWQFLFFVPHDMYGLIDLMGGRKAFANKLDTLFTLPTQGTKVNDVSGFIGDYAHGNEPCHHYAYLYNYVKQPWKSQEIIHKVNEKFYKTTPDGYIGNEDAGQMSAWYVFSAMGFYPVNPAGGIYVIGAPLLEEVSIKLENGKSFSMKAKNLSDTNKYIQSVTLNGKKLNNVWLEHKDIVDGATLEFVMGPKKSKWGTKSKPVPYANGKLTRE